MLRILLVLIFLTHINGIEEVTVKQGKLRGHILTSRKGRDIFAFQRIPYAKPPLGDLRFKIAQPPDNWEGVLDATQTAPECIQRDICKFHGYVTGQEDCLYLNVYTPQTSGSMDVMVYIHGGGWLSGTGSYAGPQLLLDHDIVLVTFDYRLGVIGFLSTGDAECPGNNGLKDQMTALRWVQDNIASFGGNPDSVTIFGESAGGGSVHYQVLSPASRGLFHRAVSHSGTALGLWAIAPNGSTTHNTAKVASLLGCPQGPSSDLLSCLRTKDAVDLVSTDKAFMEWDISPVIPFKPVLETEVAEGDKIFIPAHPLELIKRGSPVIWMTGITSADGAWAASRMFGLNLVEDIDKRWDYLGPLIMQYHEISPSNQDNINRKIRQFYFGDRSMGRETQTEVVNMFTDGWFMTGADESVKRHLERAAAPVYYYYFDYRGTYSYSTTLGDPDTDYGPSHADELLYILYDDRSFPNMTRSEDDEKMIDLLTSLWTSYARTGNPSGGYEKPGDWPPVSSAAAPEYGHITFDGVQIEHGLLTERANFWSNLPARAPIPVPKKDEL